MFKRLLFILITLLAISPAFAQETALLKGLVFKKGTSQRLSNVTITNKVSKIKSISDVWGNFSIEANLGDTLLFKKDGFQEYELPITKKQNLLIYLSEALSLKEVVVKEKSKQQQQKEILQDFRSKGVYFNGKPTLLAYIFTPLTALNELIGKDANNARRFGNYIARENAESEVDKHFNDTLIKKTVAIKDEDLAEFKYLYRPKPENVTYRNVYDDMKYIKDCYAKYKKLKKLNPQ
ncbi:MAG: hypothetical protein IE931_05445 [Sphingobacteriales bacterium]|nr:hypothetical protein [Sphingobacteriales bacterium]